MNEVEKRGKSMGEEEAKDQRLQSVRGMRGHLDDLNVRENTAMTAAQQHCTFHWMIYPLSPLLSSSM